MKIETVWEYSMQTETQRLLHTAHQIAIGFYRINNFYIIPLNKIVKYQTNVVRFPNLALSTIPRFWGKVKKPLNFHVFPLFSDKELLSETQKLLEEVNIGKPLFDSVKQIWTKSQKEVMEEIFKIMPDKKDSVRKIVVYPTRLGTTCSFNYLPNKEKVVHIYLREDQDVYTLTEGILTSLTRVDIKDELMGTWSESEIIVDWLIKKSALARVLQKYMPQTSHIATLTGTRMKQNAALHKESEDFYKNLGLPSVEKIFEIKGDEPVIYGKLIENLTPMEKTVLKLFIEKSGNVVNVDDIGNILFDNEDDFSLYAISKQIERLRNKLEENGISGSYVQTLRGQGYLLKN